MCSIANILSSTPPIVFCIIIFVCKVIEVSLSSLKTVFMVKSQRLLATILALIECIIWGFVISGTIKDLGTNYMWLISYCLGYAAGWFLGSTIEAKLALGIVSVQMIIPQTDLDSVEKYFIEKELGYFISDCRGKNGALFKVDVILPRKEARRIRKEILSVCQNKVFVINYDVPYTHGGYGIRNRK